MMPRKKKKTIILIATIVIVVMVIMAFVLLYVMTDSFKSNATLFTKYMGQNIENMDAIYRSVGKNEVDELLQQNKYTIKTQAKVNVTEEIGTSSENTENSINQLKLEIEGQVDNQNQYQYQDIHLVNQNETIAEVEYLQNQNRYGIRFSDLFDQYLSVNKGELKQVLKKAGYEETLENLPNDLLLGKQWQTIFQFSEEEKQNIKSKYLTIINSNLTKNNFSKQKNQVIQIEGRNMNTNAYSLTLTKEQMNHIYIKILEQVKQDEIILSKIDELQTWQENYGIKKDKNLRKQFIEKIEEVISEITKNNIGQETVKIIVYENNRTTVKTVIQHTDYEINIDTLPLQTQNYLQITYQKIKEEKEMQLTYKKEKEETNFVLKNKEKEEVKQYDFQMTNEVKENSCQKTILAKYEDNQNRIEAKAEQNMEIVNDWQNQVFFEKQNTVDLSQLEEDTLKAVIEQVKNQVSEKRNKIMTNDLKQEDLEKVLKTLGILKEEQSFEVTGITETEKNRFNSKFEILQGEKLGGDAILKLIDAIQDNLVNIEMVSDTELKLKLDRLRKNEELANILIAFMEKNKNKNYSAKVEYDERTGLVDSILLTIL